MKETKKMQVLLKIENGRKLQKKKEEQKKILIWNNNGNAVYPFRLQCGSCEHSPDTTTNAINTQNEMKIFSLH